jgi:UDP-N-acetylglucosamine 2-epimerase (non-hydrolysing)
MKVLTVLGTRPEIIRLSLIIPKLDALCEHHVLHTGQNYDPRLNELFFKELCIRAPDTFLGVRGASFGEQAGQILVGSEKVMQEFKPDRVLILGDTNSGLAAVVAKRCGIPVYHMEAGNRCYDDRVPEEVNRRIIDHSSDVLLPYTERSRQNLLREGIQGESIYVTGNPIKEVIDHYSDSIATSRVLESLNLKPQSYFLVTMHRAENVDIEERLVGLTTGLDQIQRQYKMPVIVSTHPRTRARMATLGVAVKNDSLRFLDPFGLFEFINLERNAYVVLSDSGTVQEECAIFGVPNVTLRDVTERPETLECGANILSGVEPESVLRCVRIVLSRTDRWIAPGDYLVTNVSETVVKIMMGYRRT